MKSKKLVLTALFGLMASSAFAAHFGYEGKEAPEYWGDLSKEWAVCRDGKFQSPIDIDVKTAIEAKNAGKIAFKYTGNAEKVINNGHTIQVGFKEGSVLEFEGKTFKLVQMHFHTPSEYTFNGEHYPMVGHIVHQADDGQMLVVAVMFEKGANNKVIEKIWLNAPAQAGQDNPIDKVDMQALVKDFGAFYRLDGSLTTPPCSEGVMWVIGKKPVQASEQQIATFTGIIGENNRPAQKANGRPVILMP